MELPTVFSKPRRRSEKRKKRKRKIPRQAEEKRHEGRQVHSMCGAYTNCCASGRAGRPHPLIHPLVQIRIRVRIRTQLPQILTRIQAHPTLLPHHRPAPPAQARHVQGSATGGGAFLVGPTVIHPRHHIIEGQDASYVSSRSCGLTGYSFMGLSVR